MIQCQACGYADKTRSCGYFCRGCQRYKGVINSKVGIAVKKGIIPPATTLECVNCGNPAHEYDHRDYSKPLDVKPMCRSCNKKMPPGLMPFYIREINALWRRIPYKGRRKEAMQLNDKGEVIWETPHPSVTNWVRTGIYQHLLANMDETLTEKEEAE